MKMIVEVICENEEHEYQTTTISEAAARDEAKRLYPNWLSVHVRREVELSDITSSGSGYD
jgi:hypothetical protein